MRTTVLFPSVSFEDYKNSDQGLYLSNDVLTTDVLDTIFRGQDYIHLTQRRWGVEVLLIF